MHNIDHGNHIGALMRARWLAELGQALEEARRLVPELSQSPRFANESAAIAVRVEEAISHVDRLRRGRPIAIADILGPKWLGQSSDRADSAN